MTTTIYWMLEHIRQGVREMRFRAACWWLSQQVELLDWRLRLESTMSSMQSHPMVSSVNEGNAIPCTRRERQE